MNINFSLNWNVRWFVCFVTLHIFLTGVLDLEIINIKKISITCRERSKVKFGKLGGGKPKISPTNCEVIILIFFSWLLMHTCYRAGCAWVNIDTGLMELAIQSSQEYSTFKQAKLISKWNEYSTCGVFDFPQMKVLNFEHSFP